MSTQKNSLTIKDLVTTGIFSALCFILVLLGGVFFGANPVLTFWMPVGSALLAGPVFLLLIAKVPKHGPLTIVGIITGLIFFVTGMHWTMCVAYAHCSCCYINSNCVCNRIYTQTEKALITTNMPL